MRETLKEAAHFSGRARRVPEIVPIVLREAARFFGQGQLTPTHFDEKLARLIAEELTPRGLELLVRNLTNGTMRFLIRDSRTASILEMIDCEKQHRAAAEEESPCSAHREFAAMRGISGQAELRHRRKFEPRRTRR